MWNFKCLCLYVLNSVLAISNKDIFLISMNIQILSFFFLYLDINSTVKDFDMADVLFFSG